MPDMDLTEIRSTMHRMRGPELTKATSDAEALLAAAEADKDKSEVENCKGVLAVLAKLSKPGKATAKAK